MSSKYSIYSVFERWFKNGTVYIYSDPHFGDKELFEKYRSKKFENIKTVEEFDKMQIDNINRQVGRTDTIIFLGDIGDTECIKKIRGYKVLIMGNHDKGASNYKRICKEVKHNSDTCPCCGGPVVHDIATALNCGWDYAWCNKCGTVKPLDDVYSDNKLFDEVYEGPLFISNKILLSHEPIVGLPFVMNLHGHDHSGAKIDEYHCNYCADVIGYKPINLIQQIKSGLCKDVEDIHRITIDHATTKKLLREKIIFDN